MAGSQVGEGRKRRDDIGEKTENTVLCLVSCIVYCDANGPGAYSVPRQYLSMYIIFNALVHYGISEFRGTDIRY